LDELWKFDLNCTGSYSNTGTVPCIQCPKGTNSTASGATLPSACVPCPAGTYSNIPGAINCIPNCNSNYDPASNCTSCTAGFDLNTTCTNCIPPYYGITCNYVCTINCNNGYCSTGINGNGACVCNENYDPTTNCLFIIPTWEVAVIASSAVVVIILISIWITYYKLTHKVDKVFEEVVIQDNIHATTELSTPKPNSAFIESSRPFKNNSSTNSSSM